MPIQKIRDTGTVGILSDIHPITLPANAWSEGNNVRMRNGRVEKVKGYREVLNGLPIAPWTLFFIPRVTNFLWVACGEDAVWVHNGTQWNDITRAAGAYTADADVRWTGGLLGNDILILNNGSQDPQAWMAIDPATPLVDLADWPANCKANCVRPFNDFLIAVDVTEGADRHTDVLRWSHPADPGAVPITWDYTDPSYDTGRILLEGGGVLIDLLPLRGINIVYGETAAWAMQYVGGPFVFSFDKVFNQTGLLSRGCAAFYRGNHVCLTQGDVVIHDGIQSQSLVDGKRRNWIFNNIDATHYQKSYVAVNAAQEEVWICFPTAGHSRPNKALVIEMTTLACSERDLPEAGHVGYGAIETDTTPIDSMGEPYDVTDTIYDQVASNPALYKPIIADQQNSKIYEAESGNVAAGDVFNSYIMRTDLELDNQRRLATVTRVYPILDGSGVVQVYIGGQAVPQGAVTWSGPYDFTIGEAYKVDTRVSGRYHAIKFESSANVAWALSGFDVEYSLSGMQ